MAVLAFEGRVSEPQLRHCALPSNAAFDSRIPPLAAIFSTAATAARPTVGRGNLLGQAGGRRAGHLLEFARNRLGEPGRITPLAQVIAEAKVVAAKTAPGCSSTVATSAARCVRLHQSRSPRRRRLSGFQGVVGGIIPYPTSAALDLREYVKLADISCEVGLTGSKGSVV